jgi:hypothetical protein
MYIYAIGDIHGDIMPLIVCLRDCCKVITKKPNFNFNQIEIDKDLVEQLSKEWDDKSYPEDLNYEWIGEDSNVVFCGDLLDNVRGDIFKKPQEFPFEEARIFMFINALNKQAMKNKGRIYKVLGNHDMYNLNGKTKTRYNTYISSYAKKYPGYFNGADGRLDYFGQGKPGSKLIGEDNAYLFLMIKDFIFVHGGISSTLLTAKNLSNLNTNLMEFIKGKNNNFDLESETIDNQITFSNDGEDGLVQDRFFGFKNGKDEQELCSVLYNRFKRICSDVKEANLSNKDYNNFFISNNHHCDPDTMKLVIGHCVQNKATNDKDNIFQSSFSKITSSYSKDAFVFAEEFSAPVYKGPPSLEKDKAIYGITVSCGDHDKNGNIDFNTPSIFRIDVGMSRGFNTKKYSDEYAYSRTPQVLKIDYINEKPRLSIVKSTLKNTLIHIVDLDKNPYEKKYNKYKSKYYLLKKIMDNIMKST